MPQVAGGYGGSHLLEAVGHRLLLPLARSAAHWGITGQPSLTPRPAPFLHILHRILGELPLVLRVGRLRALLAGLLQAAAEGRAGRQVWGHMLVAVGAGEL